MAADRAEIVGSPAPKSGAVMLPATACFVNRRLSVPPKQRTPCPYTTPPAFSSVPWSRMLVAVGFSPLVVKTSPSDERRVPPDAARTAPPVAAELSQPLPGPAGGFEQGQAITPPIP